jgi:PEGA domain
MDVAARPVNIPSRKSVSHQRSKSSQRSALCRREVFLTGIVGAFAPQILRWYVQADSGGLRGSWDWFEVSGRIAVIVLFLTVAGYVATLWDVKTLRQAFMVGLGVPSILLGPGADLAALGKVQRANAQAAYAAGAVEVRATSNGAPVRSVELVAVGNGQQRIAGASPLPLPPGNYQIAIRARGYETAEREVSVQANRTTQLDVSLRPLSSSERFLKGVTDTIKR